MTAFNMGDLTGILDIETLLTMLSDAQKRSEEALPHLYYDGGDPEEYREENAERQIDISVLHVVRERIKDKMEWNQATAENRRWLRGFCARNGLDAGGLQEMASDLAAGKTHGLIGDFGFWSCQGPNPESVAMFADDGSLCFIPDEFWEHLEVVTGSNPFVARNAQGGTA